MIFSGEAAQQVPTRVEHGELPRIDPAEIGFELRR
jgi:hypothetical protein